MGVVSRLVCMNPFSFLSDIYNVAALGRCNSTPGLVETLGQVPLEEMWVNPEEPENKPLIMSSAAHHSHGQHGQNSATSNSSIPSSEEDKSNKGHLPKINFYTSGKNMDSFGNMVGLLIYFGLVLIL